MKPNFTKERGESLGPWHCVSGCGACCYLQPEEREGLADYLSPQELKQYMSLVGADGWCIHYDSVRRRCQIYEERPAFCRVIPISFQRLFGVTSAELPEFAATCCREHIGDVYGTDSDEMQQFDREIPI